MMCLGYAMKMKCSIHYNNSFEQYYVLYSMQSIAMVYNTVLRDQQEMFLLQTALPVFCHQHAGE